MYNSYWPSYLENERPFSESGMHYKGYYDSKMRSLLLSIISSTISSHRSWGTTRKSCIKPSKTMTDDPGSVSSRAAHWLSYLSHWKPGKFCVPQWLQRFTQATEIFVPHWPMCQKISRFSLTHTPLVEPSFLMEGISTMRAKWNCPSSMYMHAAKLAGLAWGIIRVTKRYDAHDKGSISSNMAAWTRITSQYASLL